MRVLCQPTADSTPERENIVKQGTTEHLTRLETHLEAFAGRASLLGMPYRNFSRHASMATKLPYKPLIAIIGATGTGKSKLAVSLAQHFDGEVINGDALQLYEGLPIATNKISDEERKGIPHHLLGCIGLESPTWTVGTFTEEATKTIDSVHSRGKLPILVGGATASNGITSRKEEENQWPILASPCHEMLEALRAVDPAMAARWHPRDTRKIRTSLQIYLKTGRKASEIYEEQLAIADGGMETSANLRTCTLVFWTHTETEALRARTSARLDTMVDEGLLQEIRTMRTMYDVRVQAGHSVDEARGIWVAIGYKEFKAYFRALSEGASSDRLLFLKAQAVDQAKAATRQYAKRQVRWIRLKLLPALCAAAARSQFFVLDSTDPEKWSRSGLAEAVSITESFLSGHQLPDPSEIPAISSTLQDIHPLQGHTTFARECQLCKITCTTDRSWEQHLHSRKHQKAQRYHKNQRLMVGIKKKDRTFHLVEQSEE